MSSDDRKDDQTPPPKRPDVRPDAAGQDADLRPDMPEDEPADAREQAQAASFAALLDRLTAGEPLPPAMTAEERVLVETASMVRASARPVTLAPERQASLIEEAFRDALAAARGQTPDKTPGHADTGSRGAGIKVVHGAAPERAPSRAPAREQRLPERGETSDILDLGERRRARYVRALPWAVALASVAAALLLALWQSRTGRLSRPATNVVAESAHALDTVHRSRPADALIGEIPRPRADAARARIDMIYADRLIGYRDLRLRGDRL
jgi:hypothetical protein